MKKVFIFIIFVFIGSLLFSQVIRVATPNGGERLEIGQNYEITWESGGLKNPLKITLWKDGVFIGLIIKNQSNRNGIFRWNVGRYQGGVAKPGKGYKIKIREQGGAAFQTQDDSDFGFEIYEVPVIAGQIDPTQVINHALEKKYYNLTIEYPRMSFDVSGAVRTDGKDGDFFVQKKVHLDKGMLSFNVKNTGTLPTPAVMCKIMLLKRITHFGVQTGKIEKKIFAIPLIKPLKVGQKFSLEFRINMSKWSEVKIEVDYNNTLKESDKKDNIAILFLEDYAKIN